MKPSPLEIVLSLAGSVFMMFAVFHKPLGLSDDLEWPFLIAATACWIALFILQRRRRNARLTAGMPPIEKTPAKRRFWLLLILVVVVSLSGPLWLPYTGVALQLPMLLVTSVISSVLAVIAFIFGWRYSNRKV